MRQLGMPATLPEVGVEGLKRYIDDGEFIGADAADQARYDQAFKALFA